MGDGLQILVSAVLDEKSQSSLESQLANLVKSVGNANEIKVKVKLDDQSVKAMQTQLQTIAKGAGSSGTGLLSGGSGSGLRIFDSSQLKKDGQKYFLNVRDIISRAQKEFGKMGRVDIGNVFKDAKGNIQSFSASVTQANGVVEKFNFNLSKIKSGGKTFKGFVQSNSILTDKNAGTNLEKTLNYLNGVQNKIKDISSRTLVNTSKPLLPDMSQYKQFESRLQQVQSGISKITSSTSTLSSAHKRQIDSMVADLKRYAKELQSTAYASTDLKANTFANQKKVLQSSLTQNMKQWENQGFLTGDFKARVLEAKSALDRAFDPTHLDEYRVKLKLLKEEVRGMKLDNAQANALLDADRLTTNLRTAQERIQNFKKQYSAFLSDPNLTARWRKLFDASQMVTSQKQLTNLNAQIRQFEQQLISAGKHGQSFFGNLKNNAIKMAEWMVLGGVIAGIMRGVTGLYDAVSDLDHAMTELKRVTDETDASYEKFLSNSAKKSVELGTSYADFVNSAADFARLGYDFQDSSQLAEVANVYAVVGSGVNSVDEATTSVISTMKAFGIEANDAMTIVDKFDNVGNKFAITSGGIGDAMQRSASSFAAANNTIDESIALIVAANNVIQDPEAVGTMWKTVSMRIRGAKTELEEAGLETEYMAESTATLRDTIKGITNVDGLGGFDIMKDEKTFKSTYDIILGISKVWKDLSDIDQAALLELLAGKRQGNALAAAITNMDDAVDALQASMTSEGAAMAEHEKWMNSIEAKQKQFKAQYEVFANTFLNSGLIKGTFDAGTGILGWITSLTEKFGALPTLLATLTPFMSKMQMFRVAEDPDKIGGVGVVSKFRFNKQDIANDVKLLEQYNKALLKGGKSMQNMQVRQELWNKTIAKGSRNLQDQISITSNKVLRGEDYAKSAKQLEGTFNGIGLRAKAAALGVGVLNTAMNMLVSFGVGMAISGIITLFTTAANAANEARQKAMQAGTEAAEDAKNVFSLASEYLSLGNAVEAGTASRQEFIAAQDALISGLGLEGQSIRELQGDYDSLREAILAAAQAKLDSDIAVGLQGVNAGEEQATKDLNKFKNLGYTTLSSAGAGTNEAFEFLRKNGFAGIGDVYSGVGYVNLPNLPALGKGLDIDQLLENYRFLKKGTEALATEFGGDNPTFKAFSDAYKAYSDALSPMIEQIDSTNQSIASKLLLAEKAIGEPENYEDFVKFRDNLIDNLTNNPAFKDIGTYSAEELVDKVLGDSNQYTDFLSELTEKETLAAEIGNKMQTIAEALVPTDYEDMAPGAAQFHALNEWADQAEEVKEKLRGLSDEEFNIAYDAVVNKGASSWEEITAAIEQYSGQQVESLEAAKTKTQSLVSEIASAQQVLSSQSTGKSLSNEDFDAEGLKNYTSALEYNNGTLQLNAEKVRDLIKAQSDEQIAINNASKAAEQAKYLENAAQIEQLRNQLKGLDADSQDYIDIQSQINTLLNKNEGIRDQCVQYDLLSQSLREATDAYHNWLNAQNAAESGDMFDDALNAIKHINSTLNDKESDLFGRIGREDYKAAVDFIVPDTVDHEDSEAVQSYISSISDMFNHDKDGNITGLDTGNFIKKAVDAGLMYLDEESDEYRIAGQKTMEDFANGLGLSLPLVQAMFGELEEFGAEFSWADEASKTLGDLAVEANEAAEALRQMEGNEDIEINLDISGIEGKEDKIKSLDSTIKQMQDLKAKVGVDSSQVEKANSIIEYCVAQKQLLSTPTVMTVDTSAVSENMSEIVAKIQEFIRASNELELKQQLGLDTSEAQGKVSELAGEISQIDPNILATLNIDTTSIDSLQASINAISPEMLAKCGIDESAILGYSPDSKEAEVIYNPDTSKLPEKFTDLSRTVNYKANTAKLPTTFTSLTRYVNYVATGDTQGGQVVNGTAHAGGTARAGGDWGTANGGRTLVGELGREIVVDPRTGLWYTVGDYGAEFVNIPRGAIVFNHRQTESLLENGYVTGRASALVGGTAMVSGGIRRDYVENGSGSGSNSGSNSKQGTTKTTPSTRGSNGTTKTSAGSTSSKKSDKAGDVPWQEELKYYQHLRNMELLTDEGYYDKLSDLLERYRSQQETYIDDYRSLLEEAYNLERELADDWFNDREHEIFLLEKQGTSTRDSRIAIYKRMMEETHRLAEQAREYGLDDNSDYIQELQKQWWEYKESIDELYDEFFEEQVEARENALSLLENQYDKLENNRDRDAMNENLEKQLAEQKKLQELAHKEAQRLRELGVDENDEAIQKCIDMWWDAYDDIQDINSKIADNILSTYDDFIDYADDFDLWSGFDFSKVDYLKRKLAEINRLFDEGVITVERYNELLQEVGSDIYSTQKDALDDIIKRTMDLIKQESEDHVDALKDQIDAYKKIIELKKESLKATKDEDDYQKEVAKRVKEIAEKQAKLAQLDRDTSASANAEKAKLAKELADLQEDLADYQADYSYNAQIDALDKEADAFEDTKNKEISDIEKTVKSEIELYNAAIERIDADWDQLYADLIEWNHQYGDMIDGDDSIRTAWLNAKSAAEEYGSVVAALDSINQEPYSYDAKQASKQQQMNTIVSQMKANANAWHSASDDDKKKLVSANENLAKQLESILGRKVVKSNSGVWYLDSTSGPRLFHTGLDQGYVGDNNPGKSEVLSVLKKGELVFTKDQYMRIFSSMTSGVSGILDTIMSRISASSPDVTEAVDMITNNTTDNSTEYGGVIQENHFHLQNITEENMRGFAEYYSEYTIKKLSSGNKRKGMKNSVGYSMLRG